MPKPKILCVDDEEDVLAGLRLTLRKQYKVTVATSGKDGLHILKETGPVAVVISDMRMPEMDGATFLTEVRKSWPNTTRMLLTGQSEMDAAIKAVNEGQIFRFLTKPCEREILLLACEEAAQYYNLLNNKRELLERTLRGSIDLMSDVLAIANPAAFSSTQRMRDLVAGVAKALAMENQWQLSVAALFSKLGSIALSPDLQVKLDQGETLSDEEQQLIGQIPKLTQKMIDRIPHLEQVGKMIAQAGDACVAHDHLPLEMALLRLGQEYVTQEARGLEQDDILKALSASNWPGNLLDALKAWLNNQSGGLTLKKLGVEDLAAGMLLAQDLTAADGTLLLKSGNTISEALVMRLRLLGNERVRIPIHVLC